MLQPNLEGYEIHEVALKKKEGQSLGISIIGHNALTTKGKKHILPCFPRNPTINQYAVNYYLSSLLHVRCGGGLREERGSRQCRWAERENPCPRQDNSSGFLITF